MTRARHILGLAAALLTATALPLSAHAGKADNTVRFAYQQVLSSLDPYFNNAFFSLAVADQIWDTLIYRDPKTGAFTGNLATAWRRIDEKTLEFDLRQGVKFHNGADFDADDVVHTLNFVANPENKALNIAFIRWIDHAERLDKYRVRIVSRQPFPAALAYLASPRLAVFPHEYYQRVGPKGMNERPIGTGPYRVIEHEVGKHVRLERNPDYFKDNPKSLPKIDKVEIRFIPDRQTQVAEAVSGGLDLITDVAQDQAEQLRSVRGIQIIAADGMGYSYLQFNTTNTPAPQLRDIRVRQAIAHAIDREAIVKYIVGDRARVLHSECYPGQFGCTDEGVPRYGYDPEKARRLLAQAGYPNGFGIDFYAANSTSGNRNEVEAIIGYLRAVGINARLRVLQIEAVIAARRAGRVPIVMLGSSNTVDDPSVQFSPRHSFTPQDSNRDEELRDLLVRADTAIDPAIRAETYAKAFRLIAERAYLLPLHSIPSIFIASQDLVFEPHADYIPRFYEMSWK